MYWTTPDGVYGAMTLCQPSRNCPSSHVPQPRRPARRKFAVGGVVTRLTQGLPRGGRVGPLLIE